MSKQGIREIIYGTESLLAKALGRVVRLSSASSRTLYRSVVRWNRGLSDRTSLWLHPFFSALGTTLFDLRGQVVERLQIVNGGVMNLDISEKTQRQIFSHKLFEAGVSRFVLATLHRGDVFVDVGANVGYFTVLAAAAVVRIHL